MAGFKQSIKIQGLDKLKKKLEALPDAVQKRIGKSATGTMAAIVRDEAKKKVYVAKEAYYAGPKGGRVKVEPGHIKRNIIMKRIPESERGNLTSEHIVTVSNSEDGPYGAINIAVMLEYGVNMDAPHPFIRPAFDSKKQEATRKATEIIETEIKKEWNKS